MTWEGYFKKHQSRPPRPMLIEALQFIGPKPNGSAIEMLQSALLPELAPNIVCIASSFESLRELPMADFIYASFSIPFCNPESFPQFWEVILTSRSRGGMRRTRWLQPLRGPKSIGICLQ